MPPLSFFACRGCETVYASPDRPPGCDRCDGDLREITDRLGAEPYFSRSDR